MEHLLPPVPAILIGRLAGTTVAKMAESFKLEPPVKAEIKDEPGMSPAAFEDDDLYEDAGDLNFYDTSGPEDYNNVSMMRVSHDLWNRWSELSDDQEVQIGTMRIWEEPVKVGNEVKKIVSETRSTPSWLIANCSFAPVDSEKDAS